MWPSAHIKQSYSLLDFSLHTQLLYLMLQAKLRYRYFHLSFSAHPHKSIHPRSIFHERAIRLFWFEGTWPLCHPSVRTSTVTSPLRLSFTFPTQQVKMPSILFYFSQLDYDKLEVLRLWVNLLAVRRYCLRVLSFTLHIPIMYPNLLLSIARLPQ